MRNLLIKLSSFWLFYRWHPEVALRYLPIVDEIKKMEENPSILDVGSGGLGIAPYLGRKLTGVDIHFQPPFHPLLKRVKGSVLSLPFHGNTFDVVVSVDMLEHLPKDRREKAIDEMVKVAKRRVIIAVPCGIKSQEQDRILDKYYQNTMGSTYHFLDEQLEYGLPRKEEMIAIIETAATKRNKEFDLRVYGNENLGLRMFLMKGWITKNPVIDFFYRKLLLPAIPLLRLFNQEPVYRQIFIADFV